MASIDNESPREFMARAIKQVVPWLINQSKGLPLKPEEREQLDVDLLRLINSSSPGDALDQLVYCVYASGFARGRLKDRLKIDRMALKRKSSARPEIEARLREGKSVRQVMRLVPGARERTIKRVRQEMKASGALP